MKIYKGTRESGIPVVTVSNSVETHILSPAESQLIWNHSPNGFEWSYCGSGPAQLALALLLDHGLAEHEAVILHQKFKDITVAKLFNDSWVLTSQDIDRILSVIRIKEIFYD